MPLLSCYEKKTGYYYCIQKLKDSLDVLNQFWFLLLKQKVDKIKYNFFPPIHISFHCHSHLCLGKKICSLLSNKTLLGESFTNSIWAALAYSENAYMMSCIFFLLLWMMAKLTGKLLCWSISLIKIWASSLPLR